MSIVRAAALVLCWLACLPLRAADWAQPHFESVPGTDELGNGIITALAQDARGLIWIGTTEGLLRYDGYRLRRFQHQAGQPETLADNYVRALLPMPDGDLWVATQSGGVSVFDSVSERFSTFRNDPADPSSLAEDGAVALALDRDGSVWVGHANRGLDRFDPSTRRFQHFPRSADLPAGPPHGTVRALLVDSRGDLWLGTGDGLLRRPAATKRFERVIPAGEAEGFTGQYVYALYQASDGAIWVGTQRNGAARLVERHDGGWEARRLTVSEDGLGHAWVDGFVEPTEDRIWVATFGGGIDVFSLDGSRRLQRVRSDPAVSGSLAIDRLVAPLRDRSGLVWVGTWGGGVQWHNPQNSGAVQRLRHYRERSDGLSVPEVLSLLELEDNRVWIGTGGNGIDVFDPERGVVGGFRPDARREGALRDGTVRAMARTADGTRWVGTQQAGLFRFAGDGRFEPHAGPLPDRRIRLLLARSDGSLAVGTQRGLALVSAAGDTSMPGQAGGERFDDPVWSLLEDALGQLWVGHPGGLSRLGNAGLEAATGNGPDPPTGVLDLREDGRGELWALALNGLFHRAARAGPDAPWRAVPLELPEADAGLGRQMLVDADGRLWTPRYLIDPQTPSARRLEPSEGFDIGNVDMGGALRQDDGRLLFAGTRGLIRISPSAYRPWRFDPPLVVTGLSLDGRPRPPGPLATLTLAPDAQRFSVEFAALDYSAPHRNRYAYRLVGLDQDWLPLDAQSRRASYNRPWPGRYRLELRGSNRDGVWASQPLVIDVAVQPHWWQTPVFAMALLVVLGGTLALGWRWRSRAARLRAEKLQAMVDVRTAELSRERDRAEQSLQALQRTQTQLVAAEKLAALGQLVAGVAHEINTPVGVAVTAASHLRERARENAAALDSGRITRRQLEQLHADLAEGSDLILTSLARAGDLVASFKRVAVDRSEESASDFRAAELCREIDAALQSACRRAGHRLAVDSLGDAPRSGYPGTLFQVVASLVGNAIAHAFPDNAHGTISVHLDCSSDPAELRVVDDGRGMSAEVAARAFDPFFTTGRGRGNSGLGLHIVHNLVTQVLGGQIELQTEPGKGSRFLIRFSCPPSQRPGIG